MKFDKNQLAFFALVRAGLWGKDVRLLPYEKIDYFEIMHLAEEQAVEGLVTAGLERVKDIKVPKEVVLQFVGQTLQQEQQNMAMNAFIVRLMEKMLDEGVETLLVKGQGIAQCYEKPYWRVCGDVDLLFDKDNYYKAKELLSTLAESIDEEDERRLHQAITIDSWTVELHGTLRSQLGKRIDCVIDEVQDDTFRNKHYRVWRNGAVDVFLPAPDNDVIFVFTHILQHYFRGGIGLRQICDWCRLLWTYRDALDWAMLEKKVRKMGLMSEWRAFVTLAVEWLGMPVDALPSYSSSHFWKRKSDRIVAFVLETGNFGHNRDMSYITSTPLVIRKIISLLHSTRYSVKRFFVFPIDALMIWGKLFLDGLNGVSKE